MPFVAAERLKHPPVRKALTTSSGAPPDGRGHLREGHLSIYLSLPLSLSISLSLYIGCSPRSCPPPRPRLVPVEARPRAR